MARLTVSGIDSTPGPVTGGPSSTRATSESWPRAAVSRARALDGNELRGGRARAGVGVAVVVGADAVVAGPRDQVAHRRAHRVRRERVGRAHRAHARVERQRRELGVALAPDRVVLRDREHRRRHARHQPVAAAGDSERRGQRLGPEIDRELLPGELIQPVDRQPRPRVLVGRDRRRQPQPVLHEARHLGRDRAVLDLRERVADGERARVAQPRAHLRVHVLQDQREVIFEHDLGHRLERLARRRRPRGRGVVGRRERHLQLVEVLGQPLPIQLIALVPRRERHGQRAARLASGHGQRQLREHRKDRRADRRAVARRRRRHREHQLAAQPLDDLRVVERIVGHAPVQPAHRRQPRAELLGVGVRDRIARVRVPLPVRFEQPAIHHVDQPPEVRRGAAVGRDGERGRELRLRARARHQRRVPQRQRRPIAELRARRRGSPPERRRRQRERARRLVVDVEPLREVGREVQVDVDRDPHAEDREPADLHAQRHRHRRVHHELGPLAGLERDRHRREQVHRQRRLDDEEVDRALEQPDDRERPAEPEVVGRLGHGRAAVVDPRQPPLEDALQRERQLRGQDPGVELFAEAEAERDPEREDRVVVVIRRHVGRRRARQLGEVEPAAAEEREHLDRHRPLAERPPQRHFEIAVGVDPELQRRQRDRDRPEVELPKPLRQRQVEIEQPDVVADLLVEDLEREPARPLGVDREREPVERRIAPQDFERERVANREVGRDQPTRVGVVPALDRFVDFAAFERHQRFRHLVDDLGDRLRAFAGRHRHALPEAEVAQIEERRFGRGLRKRIADDLLASEDLDLRAQVEPRSEIDRQAVHLEKAEVERRIQVQIAAQLLLLIVRRDDQLGAYAQIVDPTPRRRQRRLGVAELLRDEVEDLADGDRLFGRQREVDLALAQRRAERELGDE
jgi:hypothetical protein